MLVALEVRVLLDMRKEFRFQIFVLLFFACLNSAHGGAIHEAVTAQNYSEIERLIKESPDVIDQQDADGNTAFHLAIMMGDTRILNLLVNNFADQTLLNRANLSPLDLIDQPGYPYPGIQVPLRSELGRKYLWHRQPSTAPRLIAVHQTRQFAPEFEILGSSCASYVAASDEIISKMDALRLPIVYLTGESHDGTPGTISEWVTGSSISTESRMPVPRVPSRSGDHNLRLRGSEVVLIGANWGLCHLHAATKAMQIHFRSDSSPFTLHLPVQAIHIAPSFDYGVVPELPPKWKSRVLKALSDEAKIEEVEKTFVSRINWGDTGFEHDGSQYRYNIFMNGKFIKTAGEGPFEVNLKVWNTFEPVDHLDGIEKERVSKVKSKCGNSPRVSNSTFPPKC